MRPLLANERRIVPDRVQLPRLRMEWHSPALFAPGDADLDLAAQILGGGKSSRLYKSLVFEQRIAQDAWAYQSSLMLGSLFGIGVTAKPGQGLEERALARAVRSDHREGLPVDEPQVDVAEGPERLLAALAPSGPPAAEA